MNSSPHAVFSLTFKGTSIARDRKITNSAVAVSINNSTSTASYSSTVPYDTQSLLILPHQSLPLLMMLLKLFNESPFFEHFLLKNNLKRILINAERSESLQLATTQNDLKCPSKKGAIGLSANPCIRTW